MLRACLAALAVVLVHVGAVAQNADHVALLSSKEPTYRVEGARRLVKDGDKKSVAALLRALPGEGDGWVGREMGRALKDLTEADGLAACERAILAWKKPDEMFAAYWALAGLAEGGSEAGGKIVKAALAKKSGKDVSLRACAFEAIGESSRAELAEPVLAALNEYKLEDDRGNVYETLAAIGAARKLCPADQKPTLLALMHVLEVSQDDRIKYFAAHALARITGQPAMLDAKWWRHWMLTGETEQQQGRTVAGPSFFDAVAVGTRVIFAIDISGSMEWPAEMTRTGGPQTGRAKDKGPDYSGVKTKLDLAKVELLYTLESLPENYYFNVVTYEAKHQLIDAQADGLMPATAANKSRMVGAVKALKANGGTNIHGALVRSFGVVRKGAIKGDPALDRTAMLEGVDTIFFLTDGAPSWSDDSTGYSHVDPKWGNIGNGKFCLPENILADISRMNTFRKVVIHTIAVGKDADKKLMEKLAEQNHGEYVARG